VLRVAREIIAAQPILAAFAALGLGHLIGQLNIGGFPLAVGVALTAGLVLSACAASAQINGGLAVTGIIIFF
jgi:putative transport protein